MSCSNPKTYPASHHQLYPSSFPFHYIEYSPSLAQWKVLIRSIVNADVLQSIGDVILIELLINGSNADGYHTLRSYALASINVSAPGQYVDFSIELLLGGQQRRHLPK